MRHTHSIFGTLNSSFVVNSSMSLKHGKLHLRRNNKSADDIALFTMVIPNMKIFFISVLIVTCTPVPRFHMLPFGCQHVNDNVVCKNLRTFPRHLSTDAKTVTIGQSEFDEIPSDAFIGLSRVTNLTLYLLSVKTIRACAFSSMKNLKFLDLMFSDVGTIESYAFTNITGKPGGKMSLFMLNIINIHPYAFNQIDGFDLMAFDLTRIDSVSSYAFQDIITNLSISRTNMTNLGKGAFQNLKSRVRIHNCTIQNLGCNTFADIYRDLGLRFQLSAITVKCSCDLVRFIRADNETRNFFENSIVCFKAADDSATYRNLTSLTEESLCSGSPPSTCDTDEVASPSVFDVCETSGAPFVYVTSVLFVFVAITDTLN